MNQEPFFDIFLTQGGKCETYLIAGGNFENGKAKIETEMNGTPMEMLNLYSQITELVYYYMLEIVDKETAQEMISDVLKQGVRNAEKRANNEN